jgi:hypothetical protein
VDWAVSEPDALATSAIAQRTSVIAVKLRATRLAMAGRRVEEDARNARGIDNEPGPARSHVESALAELEAAVASFATQHRAPDALAGADVT